MVVHAYYDEDPRVRREAEALVGAGRPVDVFGLRRPGDPATDELGGVSVRRLDVQRHQGAPIPVYLAEYLDFLLRAAAALAGEHRRRRYALVQVHTIPDFLVFAATPLKMLGVPIVLDFHEAMPEFFDARFPGLAGPIASWLLRTQQAVSAGFADAVIAVDDAIAERLMAAGVDAAKITIVHNSPNPRLFDRRAHPGREFMADGSLRLVYAGALTPNYELDVLLGALARLRADAPGGPIHLDIFGRGDSEETTRDHARTLGIEDQVTFHGRVPLEAMAEAIAQGDVGLAPIRRNAQTDLSLPTKILEYARMGKPVVASDLATVKRYFPADELYLYRAGDAADLAAVISRLAEEPAEAARRASRAAERVEELSWDREAARYVSLIDRVAATSR
jgi:glycosyltransferase involved in cell wall biosynthesis